MRTTKSIGAILSTAALLACLSLAQPVDARAAQPTGPRDSVVPIVVIDAPLQAPTSLGKRADDQSAAGADGRTPGFNIAVDGPADLLTPLADVPLPAWLLLATCLLCARFGPRALRRFEDDKEDAAPAGPDQTPRLHKTSLTRPRRSPG